MTSGPKHSIMINRRRILHRFKLRQNAPLGNLSIFNFLSSSNFQNIISNCGRMHHYSTSFKKYLRSSNFQNIISCCGRIQLL